MARYKLPFVFILAIISFCLCELDIQQKAKLVNGFVEFYNSLPNEIYTCDEGFLQSAQQTDISNAYDINISLKVSDTHNLDSTKYLKCTATVADLAVGVAVMKHQCLDDPNPVANPTNLEEKVDAEPDVVTEAAFVRRPIQLDNEVQTDTAVTSGEQFIAIPREDPKGNCMGCASHVNPQAQGVSELAALGVRQLNSLEPNIQHTLASVVDVERQVQVVNGVRYILTLIIGYNSCSTQEVDPCLTSKACKITILEKPWMQLPDGSKYRAILSNNCTEKWRFGDDGIVVPPNDNQENNNIYPTNPDARSDIIKAIHNVDVQSQQQSEKTLTDQDIKNLEEQIIPLNQVAGPVVTKSTSTTPMPSVVSKEHVVKEESVNQYNPNSIQTSKPQKVENLDEDKKKAIDDLLNFFNFAGFDSNINQNQEQTRMKRSFASDLSVMNIAEKFKKVKKNMENAKHVYTLAQAVVDYLNEMDLEVKDRVLKDVTSAEEESENSNSFFYLQFRTAVPCKSNVCKDKDTETKICNAVVDSSEKNPQILNVFCHVEENRKNPGKMNSVSVDDPMLHKLIKKSLKRIESESKSNKALKLNKIIDASTQRVSGTLTKFSIVLDQTNCDKSVPIKLRINCPIVEEYGSLICDVTIHERHWLQESSITYSCTDRPIDIRFSEVRKDAVVKKPNDPVVLDIVQEALQKLEYQSNRNNKQIAIRVNSVSTKLVAGFLTNIEFVVGYTNCPCNVNTEELRKCRLLENEPLKTCTAKVWDRTWIADGRQVEVSCMEPNTATIEKSIRLKRSVIAVIKEQDVNDPQMKMLAKVSLQKFLQDSKFQTHYSIIKIERASVHVEAGLIYTLDFKIAPTNCQLDDEGKPTSSDCIILNSADVTSNCSSKIWTRPWLNDEKIIDVSCHIGKPGMKVKRDKMVPGGQTVQDTNDPTYKQLAEESLQKYLQDTGNSQPHKVVEMEKVSTQVVSGRKTFIDFKVSPVTENSGDVISCHSEIWEQAWLNKKEIKVSCQIDAENKRTKRHALGGLKEEINPNDTKYKQLAEESLQKYLQDTGNSQPHKVVEMEKVSTQVVSGRKTFIDFKVSPVTENSGDVIRCHSEIWEQAWLNKKEIKVSCQIDAENKRTKRHALGGPKEEINPNDTKYKQLAEESLQKYLQDTGNLQPHKVVEMEKVSTQVVSGTNTFIDFKVSPVTENSGDVIRCHSEIWEQAWLNKKEIKVSCQIDNENKRTKRHAVGSPKEEINPNDTKYKQLAEESLQKYLQDTGNSQPHKVVEMEKVSTQVVSGRKTFIDFKVSPVTENSGDVISCHSEIWEQAWLNKKEITVSCQIDAGNKRMKRQDLVRQPITRDKSETVSENRIKRYIRDSVMAGGFSEQDPTKEEYKNLARDSLKKYQKKNKNVKGHVFVEVKKVAMQVVSGVIYKIDFIAAPKSCARDVTTCEDENPFLNCQSELLIRPWLLQKDIKVSCKTNRNRNKRNSNLDEKDELELNELEITYLNERGKRQTGIDDDYVDEDTRFYYADRAIQQLNEQSKSSNLFKLITIHAVQNSMHMDNTPMIRMYIEAAETFCLRHLDDQKVAECEEMDGNNHRLCLARVWPSPDDEMVIQQVSVVCDDDEKFESITGLSIPMLLKFSIKHIERSPQLRYKLVHQGEPHLIPSLDSTVPMKLNFIVRATNCSKDVVIERGNKYNCFIDVTKPAKACTSLIWLVPNARAISKFSVSCAKTEFRQKRSISLNKENATADDLEIQKMVEESLEKLEMSTPQRYKQKVLAINGYSTKVTSGKITTIDFDIGFTSCLKYEWVDDIKSCEIMEHLPRRHCISEVWERLWLDNGRNIEVRCEDEIVPLEAHVEFENADTALALANRALRHIEAKYPHPRKQKVVRIYSLDKQVVAGVHYRMKMEIGVTNCSALSADDYCVIDEHGGGVNKFCRVNVWLRPWTDHPPNFRVTCDYQDGAAADLYYQIQAEHLFRDFLSTYSPGYINDHDELLKRFEVFKANIIRIHELNTHERGTAIYGLTRFADLTYEEFTKKHMGLKPSLQDTNQVPMRKAKIPTVDIPTMFDWREHGAVTEVKDQGSCGSCWAFSVTGNIEGQWQLKSGKLVSLSEQELVDCDKMDDGCNGGLPDNAYRAIEQLGGLETETDYPYEGEDDKCVYNKSLSRVQITGAVNITSNETDMAKWLVKNGPISIGINANAMQFYMGGVSHPWKMLCSPSNLDHGVLIVGYGIKNYPLFHKRLPYWIVKNSWGPSWGEKGYYRVFRGDGTCGVNQMASSAVV